VAVPLIELFKVGVRSVQGDDAVIRSLNEQPLPSNAPIYLLAVGKAAGAMTEGALSVLPDRPIHGLVITKPGHASAEIEQSSWIRLIESSHPVPNDESLHAGAIITHGTSH